MPAASFAKLPILIGFGLLALATSAAAGTLSTQWTGPTVIAQAHTVWTRPVITADAHGQVHVLWADRTAPAAPGSDKGDALFHAAWDGRQWSAPVRILAKEPRAFCLVYPDAAVGSDDQLYAVWSGQSALSFSRAPAAAAHEPRSWLPPRTVVQASMVQQGRIVPDTKGRLHVIYSRLASDNGPAGNVFYVSSDDGGNSWSAPLQISRVPVQEPPVAGVSRLVVDQAGGLHAAWEQVAPPSWVGDRILYAHSEDGATWTEPVVLSGPIGNGISHMVPVLATTGRNTVHLMWGCGIPPTRCYRTSTDGGRQWSPTQRIFPQFVSMAGWDSLVVDATSTLHLVAQLRMPYGMYHAFKTPEGDWHPPVRFIGEKAFEDGHFVSAVATASGVHAVWQKGPAIGDVVYARMALAPDDPAPGAAPAVQSGTPP